MKTTITTEIMTFDELDESAKEKARAWYRNDSPFIEQDAWEQIKDDADGVGLTIKALDDRRSNEGSFKISAIECSEAILNNHGEQCETYKTAKEFQDAIDALPELPSEDADDYAEKEAERCEVIDELEDIFLKSLLEDYRIMLNKEIEYLYGDEAVDDVILANEYTFTIDGKREG